MRNLGLRNRMFVLIVVLAVAAAAGMAQGVPPAGGIDTAGLVKEMALPKDKADAATRILEDFTAQLQEASRSMVALLTAKKPEQLLDPQLSARIQQIQKTFSLKFEKTQLELADAVGEDKALAAAAKLRSAVPSILFDPAAASVPRQVALAPPAGAPSGAKPAELPLGAAPSLDLAVKADPSSASGGMGSMGGMMGMMDNMMGMMSGMMSGMDKMQMGGSGMAGGSSMAGMPATGSGAGAMDKQLLQQFKATSELMAQMLASLASQASGPLQTQLGMLGQMLANQAAGMQLLMNAAPASPAAPMSSGMGDM